MVDEVITASSRPQVLAARWREGDTITVRVIDYQIDDGRDNPEEYRLLTTLLKPDEAPADALTTAYVQRWEIESIFDEFKTHQRGPRAVLR